MSERPQTIIKNTCREFDHDKTRLMDIVEAAQAKLGWISGEAVSLIAHELGLPRVEVEAVISFYAFLNRGPKGQSVVQLCDCVSCNLVGGKTAAGSFIAELGIGFGETTPDGKVTLERASCLGMCDQGPAALINGIVFTRLSTDAIKEIVRTLREGADPRKLVRNLGDGQNSSRLISAMVDNNIRKRGPVIFGESKPGAGLRNALTMNSAEVIRDVKTARLRGRGGAGFPAGMKWDFARQAEGDRRFVLCNADEGEPGTFKDRVLLTECPDLVFEGMTIAGYAVGAEEGILYLRGEYEYLRAYLENVLDQRRAAGLLGKNAGGKSGFNFEVRIQLGAGAYICGEETALINSCEGRRGEPRDRPPFPAQQGYLGRPTIINNVETFCCVTRIMEKGAPWFSRIGSPASSGTKLFSVSGDCMRPGIYELPYGISMRELLAEVGGEDAIAVQVGGASGQCIAPEGFKRLICFDDLATGGSIVVLGPKRNLLEVASEFMAFFVDESCGWCVPCRVGNVLIKERVDKIRAGSGEPDDLVYLEELCRTVKTMSRCGLGQTSANPVLTTLANFRSVYEHAVRKSEDGRQRSFDLEAALADAVAVQGRQPVHFPD
jgi:[NiFe] hydrogenase diaphorase moiety large subunit